MWQCWTGAIFHTQNFCGGWVTPNVLSDLHLDPATYPHRFKPVDHLVFHLKGLRLKLETVQHSIRRCEFDDFLLQRSGSKIHCHKVREIVLHDGDYVIDEKFRARYLVGAGGTRCPVYRNFFRGVSPRQKGTQTTTYEHEFAYQWHDHQCHLWLFRKGLPGYAWYVPKANGYLNCGVGGVSESLKTGKI